MPTERQVRSIRPYLSDIYEDRIVVDFDCDCWQGSERESFHYDCPSHAVYVIQELVLP